MKDLVLELRRDNPDVEVVVGNLIPNESQETDYQHTQWVAFNNHLANGLAGQSTQRSQIVVADLATGFSTADHTFDGTHPNALGEQLVADRFYEGLLRLNVP